LERIREHQERIARVNFVEVRSRRDEAVDDLGALQRRLSLLRTERSTDTSDVARHHLFAVQMEMVRRQKAAGLEQMDHDLANAQARWNTARQSTRKVTRLAEIAEERTAREQAKKDAKELDDAGRMAWWKGQGDAV
jgi:flagellar export protein FliJ